MATDARVVQMDLEWDENIRFGTPPDGVNTSSSGSDSYNEEDIIRQDDSSCKYIELFFITLNIKVYSRSHISLSIDPRHHQKLRLMTSMMQHSLFQHTKQT